MAAIAKKTLVFLGKKLASMLGSGEDGKGKGCRKGCLAGVLLLCFIMAIPVMLVSTLGMIVNEFLNGETEDVVSPLEDRDTFQRIQELYIEFNSSIDADVAAKLLGIKIAYTRLIINEDYKADPEKPGQPFREVTPTIIKYINVQKPEIGSVLAYLQEQYNEKMEKEETYKFKEKEVLKFMEESVTFTDHYTVSEPEDATLPITVYYYANTTIKPVRQIAGELFSGLEGEEKKDKIDKYLLSYESYEGETDGSVQDSFEKVDLGQFTIYPVGMKIPQYYQYDNRWGDSPYGTGTVSDSGCATTSFAMVVSYLNGSFYNPALIASWSDEHGHYQPGAGTKWSFFSAAAENWGLNCTNLFRNGTGVIEKLQAGEPVIASMGPGEFTTKGHMIVLRGMTLDGKILVVDPNDNSRKAHYEKEYDINFILREAKNFWSFRKKDG